MKKNIIILLIVSLIVQITGLTAYGTTSSKYSANEALTALQWAVNRRMVCSAEQLFSLDETGDGKIDASDALLILKIAVGKSQPTPVTQHTPEVLLDITTSDVYSSIYDPGFNVFCCRTFICNSPEDLLQIADTNPFSQGIVSLDEQIYETNTVIILISNNESGQTISPFSVLQKGNRLLVQAQWVDGDSTDKTHLIVLTVPKSDQPATTADITYTTVASPLTTATCLDGMFDAQWIKFNQVYTADAVIRSRQELADYFSNLSMYSNDIKDAQSDWINRFLPAMEVRLTEGYYDKYITVAIGCTAQGNWTPTLKDISKDGTISLLLSHSTNTDDLPSGAISNSTILIDIPITDSIPNNFAVQFVSS